MAFLADKPRWRFILVNSNDLSRVGELTEASAKKLEVLLDKPGKADFQYPMRGHYASIMDKYSLGVLAERYNWRATLAYQQAGNRGEIWDPLWSGYVHTIDENWTNDTMQIGCLGWAQRLQKRMVRLDKNWSNTDDGQAIGDAINSLNGDPAGPSYEMAAGTTSYTAADSYVVRWPANSSPNTSTWIKWGGAQPNEGPGGATAYVPAPRNLKISKYQYVGQFIDQVVNIENGCDWYVDPKTRAFTVHRKFQRIKDNVILGFQWGPQNAAEFSRNLDGEREVNYFLAMGDSGTTPGYKDDVSRISSVGLIEEVQQITGVNDNAVLLAFAGAEIIVRANGVITYGIRPFGYSSKGSSPEPMVDYRVGDRIRVTARHPVRGNIVNQAVRVFGMTFSIDEVGNPNLGQLQIAP